MNIVTFLSLELRRALRNRFQILFAVLLPAFLYLTFGATQDYKDVGIHDGNVGASIMIGMALYGAIVASTAQAANAAVEFGHGWGRQLQLTAMRPLSYVLVKFLLCLLLAALPVTVVYVLGAFTGAQMPAGQWIATFLLAWMLSGVFALYGLAAGLLFNSQAAPGIASGTLVIWAFLGNLFAPLSGGMLVLGRFTPLYGINALARYPLTRGDVMDGSALTTDPLGLMILNAVAWLVVLAGLCALAFRMRAGRRA